MAAVQMVSQTKVPTASGYLAMLEEPDEILRAHALKKLLACVDLLWHEVAGSLPGLEALAEDTELPLPTRQIAAAVASRVFFHLEEPTQALRLALDAGDTHFDLHQRSPYVERLVSAALDAYIKQRQSAVDDDGEAMEEDEAASALPTDQLQKLVYRMIETSCKDGKYADALGIALEAREPEQVRSILEQSGEVSLLQYALQSAVSVVSVKSFRNEVLAAVADCLKEQFRSRKSASNDLILVYHLLKKADQVAEVLTTLFKGSEEDALLGYQLCFDLIDSGDQAFVQAVADSLQTSFADDGNGAAHFKQAKRVLIGGFSSELALSFLHKQSNADRLIMENLKRSLEERGGGGRNSILHNSAVMTHAFLNAGTTNDSFLRDYLDWMKKASNW